MTLAQLLVGVALVLFAVAALAPLTTRWINPHRLHLVAGGLALVTLAALIGPGPVLVT